MNDFAEKRDFQRMALDCEFVFFKPGSNQQYSGQVINLTSKGVLFNSSESIDVNTVVEILVTPSNSLTQPMKASVLANRVTDYESIFEIAGEILEIHTAGAGN
jgi:hypothetical protein